MKHPVWHTLSNALGDAEGLAHECLEIGVFDEDDFDEEIESIAAAREWLKGNTACFQ